MRDLHRCSGEVWIIEINVHIIYSNNDYGMIAICVPIREFACFDESNAWAILSKMIMKFFQRSLLVNDGNFQLL